jgi:cell fate regulator YaaT (PSP1 superfamily)
MNQHESSPESDQTAAPDKNEDCIVLVKVVHSSETEVYTQNQQCPVEKNDHVIVSSRYGKDLGRVLGAISKDNVSDWKKKGSIIRKATENDLNRYEENKSREIDAFEICKEKIKKHKLEMKLVSAHYLLEESKILFFFTADARVDFRELVKDLVSDFKMRIELRQIGVRDESRVQGGAGVCGRTFCCHGITDRLKPVSIKMAKIQNLSLNSMKISGPCGRLLCCLAYEYECYSKEKGSLPQEGYKIHYDGSTFKITDVNILSKSIRLESDDGRSMNLPVCKIKFNEKQRKWLITECPRENGHFV